MNARRCLLVVLLASMPSIAVGSSKAARELAANQQKWRRHAVAAYQFRLRDETCYCLYGPYYGPIRVIVRNGKIEKAIYEGERRDGYWPGRLVREKTNLIATVEDVFARVERLINSGADGAPYKIRYDRVYGFPTLVDVGNPPRMADAQWRLVVDGFKPMRESSKNSKPAMQRTSKALTRSLPLTRPLGPPVYVAACQLAPFGVVDLGSG